MAGFRGENQSPVAPDDDDDLVDAFGEAYVAKGDVAAAMLDASDRRRRRSQAPVPGRHPATRALDPEAVATRSARGQPGRVPVSAYVSRSADGAVRAEAADELERARRRGGDDLDPVLRQSLERALGTDLGGVRIHRDAEADRAAYALGARAFAIGTDVFFRAGAYDPSSTAGRRLIAHEVAHTVQAPQASPTGEIAVSEPGDRHELDADRFADEFVSVDRPARRPHVAARHGATSRIFRDKQTDAHPPPAPAQPAAQIPATPPSPSPSAPASSAAPSSSSVAPPATGPGPAPSAKPAVAARPAPAAHAPAPKPTATPPARASHPVAPTPTITGPSPAPAPPSIAAPSSPAAAAIADRIRASATTARQAADAAYTAKRAEITQQVTTATQAIQATGQHEQQALVAQMTARQQQATARFAAARAGITAARQAQRAAAQVDETRALADLQTAVSDKQRAATSQAATEAQTTVEAGTTQATRARGIATTTSTSIDSAATQAVGAASGSDTHVRGEVQSKVTEQSAAVKADLHDKGEQTATGVIRSATDVATGIRQAGQQLADSIAHNAGDVRQHLHDGTADIVAGIDHSANDSLAKIDHASGEFTAGLAAARTQLAGGIASATAQAVAHLRAGAARVTAGLDAGRAGQLAAYDRASQHVLGQLSSSEEASPESLAAFEQQATTLFGQLSGQTTQTLNSAGGQAIAGFASAHDGFSRALDGQQQQVGQRTDQLLANTADIEHAPQQLVDRSQQSREQVLGSREQAIQQYGRNVSTKISDARTGWVQQRTTVADRMRSKVDEFQTSCAQVTTNAAPRFRDAATQAAASAGGSWLTRAWNGIKEGFSRFFQGLLPFLIAFVVVFVIVAIVLAIAAGGVTLAVLGAAAAIALLIVGVVALVIGVVMAVIHRVQQLWNAPYPWWVKVLMVVSGYVTIVIVGDVLGVTPILEGIFGHDAITFEELSTEERWARATTGVLNILMLLLLHRVAKGSGGRPPEIRPPEVRPPEVRPPEVRPRDPADPADPARPRDPVRPAYDPSTRTIPELRADAQDPVRPGETEADATARRKAATDELFRRADTALPEEPRQVDVRAEDDGHAMERHGADIPFRRGAGRTIEGRIYGDPPWPRPENFSFQWISDAVMNRVVNQIIRNNWAQMRTELVVEGRSARTVDTGNLTGRGFVNDGAAGFGPRNAVEGRTSRATVVLEFDAGPPPGFHVVTAFPDGSFPLQ